MRDNLAMQDNLNIHCVDHLNRGLSYAESCFETFRIIDGAIFLWDKHWQRLSHGLACFGLHLTPENQSKIHQQCLKQAKNTASDCLIRLTISGGEAAWGFNQQAQPSVYIQAIPFQTSTSQSKPPHLCSVEFPFNLNPRVAKFTSDYALSLRATKLWQLNKPNTALINKNGYILSGLTANIALYVEGKWCTPQGDGVLNGTIRQFLIDKNTMHPMPCPTVMLATCHAAVLLNAGSFLQVVARINDNALNTQHPAIQTLITCLTQQKGVKL